MRFLQLIVFFFTILLSSYSTWGQMKIVSVSDRISTIQRGEELMNRSSLQLIARLMNLPNPFIFQEAEVTNFGFEDEKTKKAALLTIDKNAPDDVILRTIAPSIQPTGTMIKGSERVLLFDSIPVEKGKAIRASLNGRAYKVQIYDIEEDYYTLRLNNASLKRSFIDIDPGSVTLN